MLEQLDLSTNDFIGDFPSTNLSELNLTKNQLTGSIPASIRTLERLIVLDFSQSHLQGGIQILGSLTSLVTLNLSYNNFSGPIPVTQFFRTLSPNSYVKTLLCHSLDGVTCSPRSNHEGKFSKTFIICAFLATLALALFACWILMNRNRRYTAENSSLLAVSSSGAEDFSYPRTFIPFQKLNFSIENILDRLKDENVLGKGCSRIVYKAEMSNGDIIAVKKFWKIEEKEEQNDAFASEMQILGHISHQNIVKLLGYCSNKCVNLVLYEFMSNGNLQQLLEANRNLDWETRYKITLGSAQALAYLHHDCVPAILHRDVKCNNILLDSECEAYLADFGLAKLMNSPNHHAMSRVAGTYGYIVIELG